MTAAEERHKVGLRARSSLFIPSQDASKNPAADAQKSLYHCYVLGRLTFHDLGSSLPGEDSIAHIYAVKCRPFVARKK
jgi:hypothetical protein